MTSSMRLCTSRISSELVALSACTLPRTTQPAGTVLTAPPLPPAAPDDGLLDPGTQSRVSSPRTVPATELAFA